MGYLKNPQSCFRPCSRLTAALAVILLLGGCVESEIEESGSQQAAKEDQSKRPCDTNDAVGSNNPHCVPTPTPTPVPTPQPTPVAKVEWTMLKFPVVSVQFSAATDSKRNTYVSGNGYFNGIDSTDEGKPYITKYNQYGEKLWTKVFGAVETFGTGGVRKLLIGEDDSLYALAGPCILKLDTDGNTIWARVPLVGKELRDLSRAKDGTLYFVGIFAQDSAVWLREVNEFTGAIDKDGNFLGSSIFRSYPYWGDHSSGDIQKIATSDDGHFYVLHDVQIVPIDPPGTGARVKRMSLIKFDAAGNELWERQVGDFRFTNDVMPGAIDVRGNLIAIAGSTRGIFEGEGDNSSRGIAIAVFDSDGVKDWSKHLINDVHEAFNVGVQFDRNDGIFLFSYEGTYQYPSGWNKRDLYLRRLNANSGTLSWQVTLRKYDGVLADDMHLVGRALMLTPFDELLIQYEDMVGQRILRYPLSVDHSAFEHFQ